MADEPELNNVDQTDDTRTGKWWDATVHNVTAIVGAGVLSLPHAMSQLGWGPGVVVLVLSWVITLFTLWQMVQMHEMVPGRRFDRYHELGQHAFGRTLGLYIVLPQQLLVQLSACIVYMLTGGLSLEKFHYLVCNKCEPIELNFFIMIFASVHFVISHLPNLNAISSVSFAAAIMSVSYSTIAWAVAASRPKGKEVHYGYKAGSTADTAFGFFSGLGTVAFAYAGQNVVLEIQATLPSTPEQPSRKAMWKGVVLAYAIVAFCYFPVAIIGYKSFGNQVSDNILVQLKKPEWLIAVANMFVVVHLIGSYQVYAMPVFDIFESYLAYKLRFPFRKLHSFIVRSIFVLLTMIIAMVVPFFGGLLAFFGGFILAPTTYFLPSIIWLIISPTRRFSLSWCASWICIVLGVLLMILGPIGGFKQILDRAKDYKFWKSDNNTTWINPPTL